MNDDDRDTEPFAAVGPQRSSPAAPRSSCRAARVVHGWAGRRGWGVHRLGGALLLGVLLMAGCSSVPRQNDVPNEDALQAGRAFLDSYQDPDGRVVRRDQGGDTVSEGQAYAMLIAVGVRDQTRFDRSWTWSRSHLQQPSGLLAYLWKDDRVADASPAADADSQTAWALALAARQWPGHGYAAAGRTLAEAVADHEIAHDSTGRQVLAAGPWALGGHGAPVVVEPGYWAGPVTAALSELTGDGRWKALRDSQPAVLRQLAGTAHLLPPDWAHLGAGAPPSPVPAPSGGAPIGCALDGQRALVWAALDPRTRDLGAAWWQRIRPTSSAAPLRRALDGSPAGTGTSPLASVAAAATAQAAGDTDARNQLLHAASATSARYPTYYGSAWAALGPLLLTTNRY